MSAVGLFSDDVSVVQAITITAGAAGTTAINSTAIDTAGYDGVCFVIQFGAIVAGAATSIKAQQDTVTGMGTAADILGSNQTIVDTADDTVFYYDIKRPSKQFVRIVISRATQNATCSAMAYRYKGRNRPAVAGAGVSGKRATSPAEGTP